jgi:16S rRNA (guanine527-N7)-methyltransferase
MDPARIAELLHPFLTSGPAHSERNAESAFLSAGQLARISTYIDLLLRWNARINLTAVCDPESIVTRHFGESLFAAHLLFPAERSSVPFTRDLIDLGSGAGFPGLPIKIWAPEVHVTLIESSQKKATFLREVVRALSLTQVEVFNRRAEDFPSASAGVLTLRAVERFETVLPVAAHLLKPAGILALLIGDGQIASAQRLLPTFLWRDPIRVPLSVGRVVLIGATSEESGQ